MRIVTAICLALSALPVIAENRIDGLRPDAPELAAPGDMVVGVTTLTLTNPA